MKDIEDIRKKLQLVLFEVIPEPDLASVVDCLANKWYDDNKDAYEAGIIDGFQTGFQL